MNQPNNNTNSNKIINVYFVLKVVLIAFLIVALGFITFKTKNIFNDNKITIGVIESNTMTFSGEASQMIVPDVAVISMGYTSEKKTVSAAQKDVNEVIKKFSDKLKELGIKDTDIRTNNYNIYTQYDYSSSVRRLTGYQVSEDIQIKVRDLEKTSEVLNLAGELGMNEVGNLTFDIENKDEYIKKLKEEAIKDAKENAKNRAELLGIKLGDIVAYNEYNDSAVFNSVNTYNSPMKAYDMAFGANEEAMPAISSGEQKLKVTVSVTYELK